MGNNLFFTLGCKTDDDCDQSKCPNPEERCMSCFTKFGPPISPVDPFIMNGLESQCVRSPFCRNETFGNCPNGYTCWRKPGREPSNRQLYQFGCIKSCDPGMHRLIENSMNNNCPWTGFAKDSVDKNLRHCVFPPIYRSINNIPDTEGNLFIRNPAPPLCKLSNNTLWGEDIQSGYTGKPINTSSHIGNGKVAWTNNCSMFEKRSCETHEPICKWFIEEKKYCEYDEDCTGGKCNKQIHQCESVCRFQYPKVCLPCIGNPWGKCKIQCTKCSHGTFKNQTGDSPNLCRSCPKQFQPNQNQTECCFENQQNHDGTCKSGSCRYTPWECIDNCECKFPNNRGYGGAIKKKRQLQDIPYTVFPYPIELTSQCNDLNLEESCGPSFFGKYWLYFVAGAGGLIVFGFLGFLGFKCLSKYRTFQEGKKELKTGDIELSSSYQPPRLIDVVKSDHNHAELTTEYSTESLVESIAIIYAEESKWGSLEDLCEEDPQAIRSIDSLGMTVLHWVLLNCAPENTIKVVLETYPQACSKQDEKGSLPLHIACQQHSIKLQSIKLLVDAYPRSINIPSAGKLPLQLAKESQLDSSILDYLLMQ